MARLIIDCCPCKFIPLTNKFHKWKRRLYNIIYSIKVNNFNIAIVGITSSSWYRSINKALQFREDIYYVPEVTYVKSFLNKLGLIGCRNKLNILMGTTDLTSFGIEINRYCIINGSCYRYCNHYLNIKSLIGTYFSSVVLFDNNLMFEFKNRIRTWNNHSKQIVRVIMLKLLEHGKVLWDIGSGCGLLSINYKKCNTSNVICIEVNLQQIKTLVHNAKCLNQQTIFVYDSWFIDAIIGARLPDRINIGCGLRYLWQWKIIYLNIKTNGLILLTGVSNTTWTNIGILNCVYKTKLFSLTIAKLVLRLNNKIYRTHSTILFCLIKKIPTTI